MRVGFIGLGNMGMAIARNLLRAGHELVAWNRTASKTKELAGEGARMASSVADAAGAGVVATMLSDDAAVEQIVFGDDGLLRALPRGGLHISMSTISRALSERLAGEHTRAGQQYIATPVFGRPDSAAKAQLVVAAAGPAEAIERARPALDAIGRKVVVVGAEPWHANVFKLCGNFCIASMMETLSEAFAVLRKSGVDPRQFLDVINGDLFRSPVYENYGNIILDERYEPAGFKARLGLKDVRLALAASDAAEAPMPFASVLRDSYLALLADGGGDTDWAALGRVAAARAGLK